jgi:hypothetical protein
MRKGTSVPFLFVFNISINKDGLEKKVKKDTVELWLSQGWQLGGRKRV